MITKNVAEKKYFLYAEKTTLRKLNEVANKETKSIMDAVEHLGLQQTGPMEFIYFDCTNDLDKEFDLEIAIPVASEKTQDEQKYAYRDAKKFKCITKVHKGDLSKLPQVYDVMFKEIFADNLKLSNEIREVYEIFEGVPSPDNITEIQVGLN